MTYESTSYPSFYFVQGSADVGCPDEFGAMRNLLWDIAQGVTAKNRAILKVGVAQDENGARICELSGSHDSFTVEDARRLGSIVVTTWRSALAIMYGSEPNATHFDSVLSC